METSFLSRFVLPRWFFGGLLLAALAGRADTLYFQPTLDSNNNINEAWSSQNNWYFSLNPQVQATHLPEANDTVFVVLSEYACIVDVSSVAVNTLITDANIEGGNFSVITLESTHTAFDGSTISVQGEWESENDTLLDGTAIIRSGALLFLDGTTLTANNSMLYDIGQIELMDGGEIDFGTGTNQITVASDAQFTGIGDTEVVVSSGSYLTFDNNSVVESQDGTLLIVCDDTFWTNSLGVGYFTTLTSNAVIELNGPFAVQTNCTNFVSGPGTFLLYNGIETTVNGLLQVGIADPNPGILDYHAYTLNGNGTINVSGTPGLPSTLIWESGTFTGPPVNIDSQSQLIISNIYLKTISNSVVNNAGLATWLTDGNTISLEGGAVFNNLSTATFDAQNSAVIQGGAGANPSFFYNAGTFRKSVSSGSTSFAQDRAPAPSPYFLNLGLVDVETGALYLEWATNSSRYNVAQGAQLFLWTGTNVQKGTATFTGPGLLAVDLGDFWLPTDLVITNLLVENTGLIDGPGNLTVNGTLTLDYATVQGAGSLDIGPNGTLDIVTNSLTLSRAVNNAGTAIISSVGVLAAQPLTWNNLPGGSLNLASGASLGNTEGYAGPPPVLNNAGTLSNSGPNTITTTVDWALTNSGVVVVNPYAMDFEQPVTQLSGSMNVQSGAMLNVSTSFGHTFQIQGGILEGQGEVTGTIINSGTVHPGDSPGILTIGFGSLTNEPGAELAVDIAGTAPGVQYSQLNDSGGQAWLNNLSLAVTFDNGFVPTVGQSFVIWTNAQINGVFASVKGIQAGGVILAPQYSPNMVTLVAANDPAPRSPSVTNNTFSFSFQTTAGLNNLVQYTPSLSPADWQTLTNIIGNGLIQFVTDVAPTNATRFYRVAIE